MVFTLIGYSPIVELNFGPLSLSPHGLGTAIGFLAGAWLMRPAAHARGITDEQLNVLLLRGIVGALVGARLAYVLNHLGEFDNPSEWLQVWNGGASLLGGIAGGVLAALPKLRALGLPFWSTMDAAAPGFALGIAIGRSVTWS